MSYKYGFGYGRRMGKYCRGYGCVPLLLTVAVVGLGYMALKGCKQGQRCEALPPPAEPATKAK